MIASRRTACVIVGLFLAWLGLGKAHATTPQEAKQACEAGAALYADGLKTCRQNGTLNGFACFQNDRTGAGNWRGGFFCATQGCPAGQVWDGTTCAVACSSRPDYVSTPTYSMRNGTVTCFDGCEVAHFANGDGTYTGKPSVLGASCNTIPNCETMGNGYYRNFNTGHCEPPPTACDSNQISGPGGACLDSCPSGMHTDDAGLCVPDSDNCPAGQIRSPAGTCLPGEGQCASGEVKKKDGTCGKDSDGDGEADDDDEDPENDSDKEQFSGGDSCNAPPSCSGSVIMCGQARIQWRIDCNTRKDITISGGACGSMPICTGKNCNAMEYSQLLMQWRTSCKTDAAGGNGEQGIKDHMTALKQAEVNALRGLGTNDGHEGVSESDIFHTFSNDDFDPDMFGGSPGGTCSFGTSLEIVGHSIPLPSQFWTVAHFIGLLMVACAYLWVAFQLGT